MNGEMMNVDRREKSLSTPAVKRRNGELPVADISKAGKNQGFLEKFFCIF